ncbi:MAG: hypothetical protein KAJ19_19445 [Gammaproteobacteria bacterium]|nr:hypothetical protein [Gammaproteobacteria bacterium]
MYKYYVRYSSRGFFGLSSGIGAAMVTINIEANTEDGIEALFEAVRIESGYKRIIIDFYKELKS